MSQNVKGLIEIVPWESGKKWKTKTAKRFTGRCGKTLTVEAGFEFDRYTFAPDLPDNWPAAGHDKAYTVKRWDDGSPMTRQDADWILLDEMTHSWSAKTRWWANCYYRVVRAVGWMCWSTPP